MPKLPDRLQIGCYDVVFAGWHNTDVTNQLWVARVPGLASLLYRLRRLAPELYELHRRGVFRQVQYLDVTRRFPYPTNHFAYVYSSHMLEHLYPDEAEQCLREVWRVLQPGGIVRLALPDLDYLVRTYNPHQPEGLLDSLFQGRKRSTHPRARHWWHYNIHSLGALLRSLGYVDVVRCDYRRGRCAEVEQLDNRPNSLFVEASKRA
jgi:predicted SAM-dependent methyltransferase